ncbi:MAG TPA: hypothetical protein VGD80_35680 [Kofleriaceae bacterium]
MPPSPPPASPGDAAPPGDAASASPGSGAPSIDLGPTLEPLAFAPGRYAVAIQLSRRGTHARNRVRESSTMSLVLELSADGAATACRGWDYAIDNDGPTVQTEDRFREQLGFRGRYAVRAGIAEAELSAADDLCPRIAEYTRGVPRRSSTMKLRCVLAAPRTASLPGPVLLCDWSDGATPEVDALRIREVAPRPWIALAGGNGLRIKVTGAPPKLVGDPVRVTVEPAPVPIDASAWRHPF